MRWLYNFRFFASFMLVWLVFTSGAQALIFHDVDFPDGVVSFADKVVSYEPVTYGIDNQYPLAQNPQEALGEPDYIEGSEDYYVTLGSGGVLTLQFTDNSLSGSDSDALDLWIFEVGTDVEDTYVWISKDGNVWSSVGKVSGSTSGIDIDAYGFGIDDRFSYVRLQDDPLEGQVPETGQGAVGADIDAVGAISSAPPVKPVPEPSTVVLLSAGLVSLIAVIRRRASK